MASPRGGVLRTGLVECGRSVKVKPRHPVEVGVPCKNPFRGDPLGEFWVLSEEELELLF
jgi:hypothetical protein